MFCEKLIIILLSCIEYFIDVSRETMLLFFLSDFIYKTRQIINKKKTVLSIIVSGYVFHVKHFGNFIEDFFCTVLNPALETTFFSFFPEEFL